MIFTTKTVASVMQSFTKAIADLQEVKDQHQAKADNAQIARDEAERVRLQTQAEADRADLMAKKLAAFLEV